MTRATTKSVDTANTKVLIVLGYDEDQKPRGARFSATDTNLVAKAAQLMDLKVYEATTEELAALAKKLPLGRLYSNGKGFVPNVRQNLYSQIIVELAPQPQAAVTVGLTGEGRLGSHCRANQRDCRTMACELGQLRVVPKP